MTEPTYLSFETVVAINQRHCGAGAGVKDAEGIRAQLGRVESTYLGEELYPSLWQKAAVLLHGLASTQYFHDGNKRTAWLATILFLRINQRPLRALSDIEAEAFVLAIATKAFENSDEPDRGVTKAAEWFEECRRRPGHRRVEAFVARDAEWNRGETGLSTGTMQVDHAFVAELGALHPVVDVLVELVGVVQLFGFAEDSGGSVRLRWDADPDDSLVAELVHPTPETEARMRAQQFVTLDDPAQFLPFQDENVTVSPARDMPWLANGVHPVLHKAELVLRARNPGIVRLRLSLDGEVIRSFPIRLTNAEPQ